MLRYVIAALLLSLFTRSPLPGSPRNLTRCRARFSLRSSAPIAISSAAPQQQQPANADVPSFTEIADREEQTAGAITARIMLPKHPMPQIPLTKAELADLAAYILSLRDGR